MMPTNMRNRKPQKSPRGHEVVEEAARLLRRMGFSADRGAYAEGEYVAVTVDPVWNEDNQTLSAIITCYPFGHRQVDWDGMPVLVLSDSARNSARITFLNTRGQAMIAIEKEQNLQSGEYHLKAAAQWGRSEELLPPPVQEPWSRVYPSNDGQVRTAVGLTAGGELVVAAETHNPRLAGATVRFCFGPADATTAQLSGELTLEPSKAQENVWEGRWIAPEQRVVAAKEIQQNELLFCVLPLSE